MKRILTSSLRVGALAWLWAGVCVGAEVASSSCVVKRCDAVTTPGQRVFRAGDRVAWIGDSITSCAHRLPHGYITTIEKAAKETGTPGFDNIIGLGYGGWHVYSWHAYERRSIKEPGLDSRFARVPTLGEIFTNRLDVIVLALGINDHGFPTFANDDLAPWEAEYDRFISDLRERCRPRQFILCNTTTHTADPGAAANLRLARMNERIAALAKRHGALLVDFRTPAWQAIERVRRMKTGLRDLEDLIHPKEIGHAEMARAFCRTVGETAMVRWLDGEVERRYAALSAKLGAEPRLVCALRPDRKENLPGVQRLAYDIPWNLVGADEAKVSVALPAGWRVIEKTLSPSNGLLRVFGHPTRLVNPVTVTARLKDRVLTETVPIPAPWLVSHDFAFPEAWKGAAWQTNAVPPVALADVKDWSLVIPTWDFAGDVDPGALDLRSVNTGYPRGAAYVRRQLYAPRAMTLKLVLGTTFWSARNGIRIWLDGRPFADTQLVSGWEKGKPFACEDRAFALELAPGWHDLVLLTANREFDHYFHCRILDAATGKVPDDLRIACTPQPAVAKTDATPFKYLFFDDQRLYARENLRRELGRPQAVAKYQDPDYDMPLPPAAVFKCPDGKYRMLYQVYVTRKTLNRGNVVGGNPEKVPTRRRAALALAVSDDGLSFRPDTPHLVSDAWGELGSSDEGDLGEVAFVIEDAKAPAAERYKLFGCTNEMEFRRGRGNYLLASGDLKSWRRIEGARWHDVGTEPITSCFWNESQDAYTVLLRPQAGERRVGWSLTKDFRMFTKPQFCMQCDPEDEPLAELYGAFGFAYDGWHLAMPLLFGGQPSEMRGKGRMGTMTPQLAYSMNGLNFQRVFHKAFLDGNDPSLVALTGTKCPMIWPGTVRRDADGSILLHSVCCGFDHGGFYRANRNTWIVAWRLREDGFVRLVSEDPAKDSVVGTRDTLWRGGELRVNLACRGKATVAVYAASKPGGLLAPVPGYGHADCEPFTGDSTRWTPTWRGGSLEAFKGRRVAFELRFRDGEAYSLAGNMTPMMWVQVQQYEEACVDPTRPGW